MTHIHATEPKNLEDIISSLKESLDMLSRYNVQCERTTNLENCTIKQDHSSFAEVMTVDDLAAYLNVSKPTAYELVNQKNFPSFKVGKSIRINRSMLQKWMETQSAR